MRVLRHAVHARRAHARRVAGRRDPEREPAPRRHRLNAVAVAGALTGTLERVEGPHLDWLRADHAPAFDPVVFDADALARRGLVTGTADAGRGGAVFFELDGAALVLRRYRRGGLVRHLSRERYASRGAARSRPAREFRLLLELEAMGLPAPRAFAARRTRHGPFESGALVTHRLPGRTFAERLAGPDAPCASTWSAIGACIARFHRAGVLHADLNAHNVLVADDPDARSVALIDFDRGRRLAAPLRPAAARANLARLRRSIDKVAAAHGVSPDRAGIERLADAWREGLSTR